MFLLAGFAAPLDFANKPKGVFSVGEMEWSISFLIFLVWFVECIELIHHHIIYHKPTISIRIYDGNSWDGLIIDLLILDEVVSQTKHIRKK